MKSLIQKKSSFRRRSSLDLTYTDICGSMQIESGKHYFLTFIDDHSRYCMTYLLRSKDEVLAKLKQFVACAQNEFGKKIKAMCSDNGTEYCNQEVEYSSLYLDQCTVYTLISISVQCHIPHHKMV